MVAYTSIAVLVILVMLLGFVVSLQRGKHNVIKGVTGDGAHPLDKAVRAHGNTSEYAAILAVLFLALASSDSVAVEWLIIAVTAGRVLAAIGFLICESLDKIHPLKAIGAITTYFGGIALAVMLALEHI